MSRPSKFAPEFKARAIDLYRSSNGRTIADVARELGIGTETFRKWVRQDEADRGERDDRLTSKETEELKRLRKENAELKRSNEILRLASAFSPRRPTRPGAGRDVCGNASSHLLGLRRCSPPSANRCPPSTTAPVASLQPRAVADAAVVERIEAIWECSAPHIRRATHPRHAGP